MADEVVSLRVDESGTSVRFSSGISLEWSPGAVTSGMGSRRRR